MYIWLNYNKKQWLIKEKRKKKLKQGVFQMKMKKYLSKVCFLVAICVLFTSNISYAYAADNTFDFRYDANIEMVKSNPHIKNSGNKTATVIITKTNFKKNETVEFYLCNERGVRVTDVVKYNGNSKIIKLTYLSKIFVQDKNLFRGYRLVGVYKGGQTRRISGKILL